MKAMLAASKIPDLDDINFPVLASPKLDGIRCLMVDGKAYSREGKLIPNKFVQSELAGLGGLDGELMVRGDFEAVTSGIMSVEGEPDFSYHVFDRWDLDDPFKNRYPLMGFKHPRLRQVQQKVIRNKEDLNDFWDACILTNYEGVIVRDPFGEYKQGRSTLKEGGMLKLKKFKEAEGVITGYTEKMINLDTSTTKKENMVGANVLGALLLSWNDMEIKVGSGFTDQQ